jgi:hypothetical protein
MLCASSGLAEDKAEKAEQLWKRHYLDLSRAASEQTLMVNELVDMDWRFGGMQSIALRACACACACACAWLKTKVRSCGRVREYVNIVSTA